MKMKDYLLTITELRKENHPVRKHMKEHYDVELMLNRTGRKDSDDTAMRARISFYKKATELISSYDRVAMVVKNDQIVFYFLNERPKGIKSYKLCNNNAQKDKYTSIQLSGIEEKIFRTKWAGKGYPAHLISAEVDGGIEDGAILRIDRAEGVAK